MSVFRKSYSDLDYLEREISDIAIKEIKGINNDLMMTQLIIGSKVKSLLPSPC